MNKVTPIPVLNALKNLGNDLKSARKKRRISMVLMSERAGISRATLAKIEGGDGSVSMANYASVIFVLGLVDQLGELFSAQKDLLGLDLQEAQLPKRIRYRKNELLKG